MGETGKTAKCIMVQGTGSHAGKSVLAAALCRIFYRDGYSVAPFKAQNMSLNSYVTPDGREIARAQVMQAHAAGVEPHTDMNPILLKPASDCRAQVILSGRPECHMDAWDYHHGKMEYFPMVVDSLERLRQRYDIVVIEGAGSPAEINLKDKDITNMKVAQACGAPVLLVGDIDLGGVFASLVGTLELLDREERGIIGGFVINKFRGSRELLDDGLEFLENRTGIPVAGVVPYVRDIGLDEEDSISSLEQGLPGEHTVDIAVVLLPHISNTTDFDPLAWEAGVRLRYVSEPREMGRPDAVIIPGTKNTASDLEYIEASGMATRIRELARGGTTVLGICGGYQMLGTEINDPDGVESGNRTTMGLGLLPVSTCMTGEKATSRVEAYVTSPVSSLGLDAGLHFSGYEIHMGESKIVPGTVGENTLLITKRSGRSVSVPDGVQDGGSNVFGCYIHGLFENGNVRTGFLNAVRKRKGLPPAEGVLDWRLWREGRIDRFADTVRSSLDMELIYSLVNSTDEESRSNR